MRDWGQTCALPICFSRVDGGGEKDGAKLRTLSGRGGFEVAENLRFEAAGRYADVFAELDPTATRDGFAETHDRVWSGRVGAELGLFDGLWTQHLDLYGRRARRRFGEESRRRGVWGKQVAKSVNIRGG